MTWQHLAACRNVNPEVMYPTRRDRVPAAKALCRECPVKAPCLDYAETRGEIWGVWGGLTEAERLERRNIRRSAAC